MVGHSIGQGGGSLTDALLLPIYCHHHVRLCSERCCYCCHDRQVPDPGRDPEYFLMSQVALLTKGAGVRVQGQGADQSGNQHKVSWKVENVPYHPYHRITPRLLSLPGDVVGTIAKPQTNGALQAVLQKRQAVIQKEISERNARFFEAEADKLDGWADDLKIGLEREIKELDRQIKEARRAATAALTLEEKLAGQKQIKALEAQRNQKRRSLFDAQDEVDSQREQLIARIEGKLRQQTRTKLLFTIAWKLD
jgi:hypothetical protein